MAKTKDPRLDVFGEIDKLNPYGAFLSESALSKVDNFFDTGCMSLNAIISGSLKGGIPNGRVTTFYGDSGTGKTYIMSKIAAMCQKKYDMIPVFFDSENAVDEIVAEGVGLDTSMMKHYPVQTVEETRNQIVQLLNTIIEKEQFSKYIIIIDSLGNLESEKEGQDAQKNKSASDMGSRAKAVASMLRMLTNRAAKAKVPILFSNHVYDDPSAMYGKTVKDQSGGKKVIYLPSVAVQLSIKREEDSDEDKGTSIIPGTKRFKGITLNMLVTKNRVIPPFLEGESYLSFKTGLSRYAGLKDMAERFGVIKKEGLKYFLNGEEIGQYKKWKTDKEVWKKLLPAIEKSLKDNYKFSKVTDEPEEEIEF